MDSSRLKELAERFGEFANSPTGHATRGALLGASAGWAYDKLSKGRKSEGKQLRRMAVGALTGALLRTLLHDSFTKKAQVWGYYAPAHDPVAAQEANSDRSAVARGASKAGWGVLGAGAGLLKHHIDNSLMGRLIGLRPQGEIEDYLAAGWKTGKENSDLLTASTAQGVAEAIPFADGLQEKTKAWADREQKKRLDAGMDPNDLATARAGAGAAGSLVPWLAYGQVGRGFSAAAGSTVKALGGGQKMVGAAQRLGGLTPYVADTGRTAVDAYQGQKASDELYGGKELDAIVRDLQGMNPSDPRYRSGYEALKAYQDQLKPGQFESLPVPTVSNATGSSASDASPANGLSWYQALPDWGKSLAWGVGGAGLGALLGGLFGKKGAGWKMALLGLLLGSLGGNGGIGKIWDTIRGGASANQVG